MDRKKRAFQKNDKKELRTGRNGERRSHKGLYERCENNEEKYFVKINRCKITNMEGHRGKRVRWDVVCELEKVGLRK
jgi:hypothetical protein